MIVKDKLFSAIIDYLLQYNNMSYSSLSVFLISSKKSFCYLHFFWTKCPRRRGSWPYSRKRVGKSKNPHFVINKWVDSNSDQNEKFASALFWMFNCSPVKQVSESPRGRGRVGGHWGSGLQLQIHLSLDSNLAKRDNGLCTHITVQFF